jgi:hypothetical protein
MPDWLSWFVWLKLMGENGAKIMALTTTAITKMAIKTMAAIIKGSFLSGLSGLAKIAGARVTTGVPHFWQKRAKSSILDPHLRQYGNTETSSYTVLRLANLRFIKTLLKRKYLHKVLINPFNVLAMINIRIQKKLHL